MNVPPMLRSGLQKPGGGLHQPLAFGCAVTLAREILQDVLDTRLGPHQRINGDPETPRNGIGAQKRCRKKGAGADMF